VPLDLKTNTPCFVQLILDIQVIAMYYIKLLEE
jgi:hypothetical protein